jgi:hypothetical protein
VGGKKKRLQARAETGGNATYGDVKHLANLPRSGTCGLWTDSAIMEKSSVTRQRTRTATTAQPGPSSTFTFIHVYQPSDDSSVQSEPPTRSDPASSSSIPCRSYKSRWTNHMGPQQTQYYKRRQRANANSCGPCACATATEQSSSSCVGRPIANDIHRAIHHISNKLYNRNKEVMMISIELNQRCWLL